MNVKLDSTLSAKGKCEAMAAAQEALIKAHGSRNFIGTTEAWLINYGREFTYRPRPEWLKRMTPRLCFFNSMVLAMSLDGHERGLTYCEGFVTDPKCPLNIHHAWTVDEDGVVHDPTLPEDFWEEEKVSYFGVNIADRELLIDYFGVEGRGTLFDHRDGRKLIEDQQGGK